MSDPYQPLFLETAEAATRFLETLQDVKELAIDTEAASFHRFKDRVYLLQLSTRNDGVIIDPLQGGALDQLGKLIQDPRVEAIFHDADYDVRLLKQDYGWEVNNIFDTRIAAQLIGLKSFGLAALLEKYFGVKLDKAHQRSDWSMRPLSASMLEYAAQDTRYLLPLKDELLNKLETLGRTSWAREEFLRLESIQFAAEDSENAFFRVKGARDLTPRELAVLRELVTWRDSTSKELDRATFRVMGNEVLLSLSREQPVSFSRLSEIRGISRTVLDRYGEDILSAIKRGLDVPESELPRFPKPPRWARDPDFDDNVARLRQVREKAANLLELDPGVLCARDRLEAVARKKPRSLEELKEMPELRRWQIEVLGEDLIRALK